MAGARKKNWGTWAVGAVLLLIVVLAFVLRKDSGDKSTSFDEYEGSFAVENIDDVARIVLTHGRERTIELNKTSTGWIVNNKYKARMSSVMPLLEVIERIEIQYIPTKKAVEHINWDIAAHGIQTDVYDGSGNLLKSYFVGGSTFDEMGTHVRMNGSDNPFVTHVRTMDGSFRPRFTLTLDDWRDRHFLNISQENVQRVEVTYPKQNGQSFVLTQQNGDYEVNPMFPGLRNYPSQYRNGTAQNYLRELVNAACESFDNNYALADSIRSLQPFSTIAIHMEDSTQNVTLNLYPKGNPIYSEFSGPIHRLMIDMQPGDFLLAQYQVIKGFLRGYDYFFEGPEYELVF